MPITFSNRGVSAFILALILTPLLLPAQEGDAEGDYPFILEGEEITFTASPPEAGLRRTIEGEDVSRLSAPSVLDLLERAFGLSVSKSGGQGSTGGISIRGFASNRVAIVVDDVPLNSAQSGSPDLSSINPDSIESITLVYGSPDPRQGAGAVGGTVYITTKTAPDAKRSVVMSLSNTAQVPLSSAREIVDSQRAALSYSAGSQSGGFSLGAFAQRAGNRFRVTDQMGRNGVKTHSEVMDTGFDARATRVFADSGLVSAALSLYGASKEIPGSAGGTGKGFQTDKSFRSNVKGDSYRFFSDDLSTSLALSFEKTNLEWTSDSDSSAHDLYAVQGRHDLDFVANRFLALSAGSDLRWSFLNSTNTQRVSMGEGGVWISVSITPSKTVLLEPSFRIAFDSRKGDLIPVPKISLAYRSREGVSASLSVYRAYKIPEFNSLYWKGDSSARGNPDLKNEDGIGGDITAAIERKDFFLQGAAYVYHYHNAVMWRQENSVWMPQNAGKAWFFGFDLAATGRLSQTISAMLDYGYLDSRILSSGFTFSDNKKMPYQSTHRFRFTTRYEGSRLRGSLSQRYQSGRFTSIENVSSLPSFFTLDADLTVHTGKRSSLTLAAANILGERYVLVEGYPLPETTITLSFRASLF